MTYFHLISRRICLKLTLKVFHYITPRLSKHNLPITFSAHFLSKASNYYLFPNKPLILYLLDFIYNFFFSCPECLPNPWTSASPGSTRITSKKPSMIPSARCNHTFPYGLIGFYLCFSSRTHHSPFFLL